MGINWIGKSKETLQRYSQNKQNFNVMICEWIYSGESHDLEEPCEECELCGYREIRYQFSIVNKLNGNELLVGSECITRFDLSGIGENGEYIDSFSTQKRVQRDKHKLIKEAQFKRVLNCLIQLQASDHEFDLGKTVELFGERGAFSPNHILLILWRLKENGITYNPKDFKVSLKRNREKEQLENMPDWKLSILKTCLSPAQKKMLELQ